MSRVRFTQLIVNEIGKDWIKSRNLSTSPQSNQPAKGYGVIQLPGVLLRRCQVCTAAGKKVGHITFVLIVRKVNIPSVYLNAR